MYLSILLTPLAVFLAAEVLGPEVDTLRLVSYYDSSHYSGAEQPFGVSPSEILPEGLITREGIEAALTDRDIVIEVCRLEQTEPRTLWHKLPALEDRHRSCDIYGPLVTKRQP